MTKTLDTLAIVDELKGAGFNDEQSRAICATVHGGLVTKDEFNHTIKDLKMEMDHRFDKMDTKFNMMMWMMGLGFAAIYGLKLLV